MRESTTTNDVGDHAAAQQKRRFYRVSKELINSNGLMNIHLAGLRAPLLTGYVKD